MIVFIKQKTKQNKAWRCVQSIRVKKSDALYWYCSLCSAVTDTFSSHGLKPGTNSSCFRCLLLSTWLNDGAAAQFACTARCKHRLLALFTWPARKHFCLRHICKTPVCEAHESIWSLSFVPRKISSSKKYAVIKSDIQQEVTSLKGNRDPRVAPMVEQQTCNLMV